MIYHATLFSQTIVRYLLTSRDVRRSGAFLANIYARMATATGTPRKKPLQDQLLARIPRPTAMTSASRARCERLICGNAPATSAPPTALIAAPHARWRRRVKLEHGLSLGAC